MDELILCLLQIVPHPLNLKSDKLYFNLIGLNCQNLPETRRLTNQRPVFELKTYLMLQSLLVLLPSQATLDCIPGKRSYMMRIYQSFMTFSMNVSFCELNNLFKTSECLNIKVKNSPVSSLFNMVTWRISVCHVPSVFKSPPPLLQSYYVLPTEVLYLQVVDQLR